VRTVGLGTGATGAGQQPEHWEKHAIQQSYENFGQIKPDTCGWSVKVKSGKFNVLTGGKVLTGRLAGDSELVAKYENGADAGVTTTTGPQAS
jgi:hypothetical protein